MIRYDLDKDYDIDGTPCYVVIDSLVRSEICTTVDLSHAVLIRNSLNACEKVVATTSLGVISNDVAEEIYYFKPR
jgi:hypothetical protein